MRLSPCVALIETVILIVLMPVHPLAAGPIGLDAVSELHRLPELRRGVRTYQASSHDPSGGNGDTGHYLSIVGQEQTLLDVAGPGCIYRIWLTGQNQQGQIRIYLDRSPMAAVEMTLAEFFSGTTAPFLAPLVANDSVSSGGFYCYLPIPFRTGCRITTTGGGHYYNITYQVFADDTGVSTFTDLEDSSAARAAWQNAGLDPKPDRGAEVITRQQSLAAGQAMTPVEIGGAGTIQSLQLRLPGMSVPTTETVTDDGRAFTGKVNFRVAVDPANQGVRLTRRIDYGICDQKGGVYIDGVFAGEWLTPGSAGGGVFYDTSFDVPAGLTAGKSALNIEIRFISACLDWNEFYYWIYSRIGGQWLLSDELDVGGSASESAHQYVITTQNWSGTRTFQYYVPSTGPFREVLRKTRLVVTWDGGAAPAVDAPLASFFGAGTGPARVAALPVGIDSDRLYCYFPMPYAAGARVEVINEGAQDIEMIELTLRYTPSETMPPDVGYFHARYREESPTTLGRDYLFLEVPGTGHLVGVVQTMHTGDGNRGYLEGDERIHVDGSRTPALYGTGTEDLYNGGWYFNRGPFTLPVHGNPVHEVVGGDTTVAYRLFLSDPIPFNQSIRVGIEHGAVNDFLNDIASVAFYYLRPESTGEQTDELDVGDPGAETQHGYAAAPETGVSNLSDTYEGDDDNVTVSDQGRLIAVGGESRFSVRIHRGARQIVLRRRMDFGIADQRARVYVNDALAGTWYDAGANPMHRLRDSEFMIPPALAQGRSRLDIRVANDSPASAWSEYRYWIFSLDSPDVPLVRPDFDGDGDVDMEDFGHLQICLTGLPVMPVMAGCEDALLDDDGDIDGDDKARFLNCFSGPNQTPESDCEHP